MAAGRDKVVVITGGTVPHIGATAVATPRPSLTGKGQSASVSVICQLGHLDDEFARGAAQMLSRITGGVVTVTVGIHIDNAQAADLEMFQFTFNQLLELIKNSLSSS